MRVVLLCFAVFTYALSLDVDPDQTVDFTVQQGLLVSTYSAATKYSGLLNADISGDSIWSASIPGSYYAASYRLLHVDFENHWIYIRNTTIGRLSFSFTSYTPILNGDYPIAFCSAFGWAAYLRQPEDRLYGVMLNGANTWPIAFVDQKVVAMTASVSDDLFVLTGSSSLDVWRLSDISSRQQVKPRLIAQISDPVRGTYNSIFMEDLKARLWYSFGAQCPTTRCAGFGYVDLTTCDGGQCQVFTAYRATSAELTVSSFTIDSLAETLIWTGSNVANRMAIVKGQTSGYVLTDMRIGRQMTSDINSQLFLLPASCGNDCSSNGACLSNNQCKCFLGFYTPNCAVYCDAYKTCSGHGTCNSNGACVCSNDWYGSDCGIRRLIQPVFPSDFVAKSIVVTQTGSPVSTVTQAYSQFFQAQAMIGPENVDVENYGTGFNYIYQPAERTCDITLNTGKLDVFRVPELSTLLQWDSPCPASANTTSSIQCATWKSDAQTIYISTQQDPPLPVVYNYTSPTYSMSMAWDVAQITVGRPPAILFAKPDYCVPPVPEQD